MIDATRFRQLALSFEGTEQAPHFDRIAFKVTGRKIFATLLEEALSANILLAPSEQAVYTAFDEKYVYPVPNKWGLKGWTTFELKKLPDDLVSSALFSAYREVLQTKPKKKKG
jgi:hypothetical protein